MTNRALAICVAVALASCTPTAPKPTPASEPAIEIASAQPPAPSSTNDTNAGPDPGSTGLPQPKACRLWDPKPEDEDEDNPSRDGWLLRWSTVREAATLLSYDSGFVRAELERGFPEGYHFFAVTPQGPTSLEAASWAQTEVNTMNGPEPLYLLVLRGEDQQPGSAALFLPQVCTKGTPKLRPLVPEALPPLGAALKAAGKHVSIDLKPALTVVSRAAVGNGATHVVNYYEPSSGNGNPMYPSSAAFTMKADGTVVDVLLIGETPNHSYSFPYAVDLEGDGIEELIHLHDVWEGENEIHVIGWRGGKPRSVYVDSAVERTLPK